MNKKAIGCVITEAITTGFPLIPSDDEYDRFYFSLLTAFLVKTLRFDAAKWENLQSVESVESGSTTLTEDEESLRKC